MKMPDIGLNAEYLNLIQTVLAAHTSITKAVIFGSRAKGTHKSYSDIDIALFGDVNSEEVKMELDELPIPYDFDVINFHSVENPQLCEHIERVGVQIYPN